MTIYHHLDMISNVGSWIPIISHISYMLLTCRPRFFACISWTDIFMYGHLNIWYIQYTVQLQSNMQYNFTYYH